MDFAVGLAPASVLPESLVFRISACPCRDASPERASITRLCSTVNRPISPFSCSMDFAVGLAPDAAPASASPARIDSIRPWFSSILSSCPCRTRLSPSICAAVLACCARRSFLSCRRLS